MLRDITAGVMHGDPMAEQTQKPRKRRPTPPLTVNWLVTEAMRHLQRWPASEQRVRRLLWDRVKRAQSFHGGTKSEAAPLVSEAMASLVAQRVLDDGRLAELWVDSLMRRGTSRRMIVQKLRLKGIASDHITAAIEGYESDDGVDPEYASAMAYAKRRRLGVYRKPVDESYERRQKDLASMARAGFAYSVAQDVLKGDS